MTDQRFCVHNPPVQCVEVKFVTIVDGFDTQRHFVLCSRFGESLYTNTGARASTVKSIASNYKPEADDEESDCDSFDK